MATPKQPQGDVTANFERVLPHDNRYANMSELERARNNKRPLFRGIISSPEDPEQKFEYAVWDYVGKDGKPFLAGPVRPLSTRSTVEDHLERAKLTDEQAQALNYDPETGVVRERGQYELSPHTIIIRENTKRIGKYDPAFEGLSDAVAKENAKKPSYWLKWQREAGTREVRGSLWDKSGRYGPFLGGNTQYPLTREEAQALHVEAAPAQSLEAETAGKKRARGGRGD